MRRGMLLLGWGVLAATGLAQTPGGSAPATATAQSVAQPMVPETLRNFNCQELTASWNNRRWQLVCNNEVIKDFGPREQDARQAVRLIHELGVNQYGMIGAPYPVMEYWLVNGAAPRGLVPRGLRSLDLTPGAVRIEQVQGQWCLCSGQRVVFSFGLHPEQAFQALAVVLKYGFTQVAVVGQAAPSMYVFLRRPDDGEQGMPAGVAGVGGMQHMGTQNFSRVAKNPDGSPHVQKIAADGALAGMAPALAMPLPAAKGMAMTGSPVGLPVMDSRQSPLWRGQPHFGPSSGQSVQQVGAPRVPFDWRQVQLRQDGAEWKLMSGGLVLGNFGSSNQDAQMALSAIRYYRFTEQMHAGDLQHPICYYLANGQAPRGVMFGLQSESFEPDKAAVQKAEDGYSLTAGPQVLVRFGERQDDARKLLEAIQRNKFDRLCKLGEPGREPMTLLVRSR